MYEELIEKYHLKGADPDFYKALSDGGDFSPWLSRDYLDHINSEWLFLEDEPFHALCLASEKIASLPDLCRLACAARTLLFERQCSVDYLVHLGFPRPVTEDPLVNDFFGLLVHLSGMENVRQRYEAGNIPLSYMKQSYRSVRIWIDRFHRFYGRWGHDRECPRMVFIENFRFLRIGRLEYEMDRFYGRIVILRNKTGDTVALSEGDVPVNQDGLVAGTNDFWDPCCLRTTFRETADAYIGQEILEGRITGDVKPFPKSDWYPLIRKGEKCINVHIPKDGRLEIPEVKSSFAEAVAFFKKYFPEWEFPVFQCHSWLLDDTLSGLLGDDSNIAQFQKLFCCFPEESSDFGAMINIFTEAPFDLVSWEPATTLQRKVQELYRTGRKLHSASGFILADDV